MNGTETDPQVERSCMMAALKETQDTIRSYDTKAQIVGIGFIFTLGILTDFGEKLPEELLTFDGLAVIAFWFFVIGPLILFGAVLYPSRRGIGGDLGKDKTIRNAFYFGGVAGRSLDDYLDDLSKCDWRRELAFELLKTNRLREIKRKRFIRALLSVLFSYGVIAASQILRVEGMG